MKVDKILKFATSYCGPCKVLKKELEDFDLVPIESLDADENEDLCLKYKVRSVPVLIFLDNEGTEIGRRVGLVSKKDLIEQINNLNETV